ERALPLFTHVLEKRTDLNGRNDPLTLLAMSNLSGCYRELCQFEKALPLDRDVLERTKERFGPTSPAAAEAMHSLATLYWSMQDLDKSIPLFEEALSIQRQHHGEPHPTTLQTLANLASNHHSAEHHAKAAQCADEFLDIYWKMKPQDRHHLAWFLRTAGSIYDDAGAPKRAEEVLRRAVAECRNLDGKASSTTTSALASLGLHLLKQKRWDDAEPILRECLTIREEKQPDSWLTFNTKSMLGGAFLGQKKFDEAVPLLLDGYEGMKKREGKGLPGSADPNSQRTRIVESLERLVMLYDAWDKKEEADKWRKELQAYKDSAPPKRSN
ncbi:MAG TPA: tetratricopeptide repeat protein, partial [Gemmata sp.]|nr:tetratricopeptide repeat protein [Gemmata sp.]